MLQLHLHQVPAVVGVVDVLLKLSPRVVQEPNRDVVGTARLLRVPDITVAADHETSDEESLVGPRTLWHGELHLQHLAVPVVLGDPGRAVHVAPASIEAAL